MFSHITVVNIDGRHGELTAAHHLEDVQLCIDMRSTLEQAGVKFAPLEMAKNFADGPTAVRPEPATLRCRALRPLLTR
jgi:hypothetical protein